MSIFFKKHRINIFIILIFLILPFIFFKDTFKLNSVILGSGDPIAYYIPLNKLKIDLLKNLELPFWNRYNFCGFPLLSNPQASIFYPVTLIFGLLFSTVTAYNLSLLLHYSLAGIFLYLFLNEYKLNKLASFTAGLIFMFSGAMITHKSHPTMLYTIVWVPLILLFLEKYRKSKRFEFVLISSVIYSISFFAGHPQIFLYSSLVILLFIIYYTFIYEGGRKYYFLLSGLIFVIGLLIMSVQLIPSYELMKSGFVRNNVSYHFFSIGSLHPKLLPILFFPFIFGCKHLSVGGIPHFLHWFGIEDSVEMIIYFGISTLPFLLFGFFVKNRHKYFWMFILSLSFLLVLGKYTPLNKLIYYIPLFGKFKNPTRNWYEFGLALSVLIGFGFDYFIRLDKKKIKKIVIGVIVFLSSVIVGFFIFYLLLNGNFQSHVINFFKGVINVEYLKENIKLINYSIYMPLIIITITLSILILSLFKKNKFLFILIVLIIFLDLFSVGRFDENNTENIFENKDMNISTKINFLCEKEKLFRILPLIDLPEKSYNSRNSNILFMFDNSAGYDPLILDDYSYIINIEDPTNNGLLYFTDWQSLLRNNIIISMLNTEYIIVPVPEDMNEFRDNITKSYWKDIKPTFDEAQYDKGEFKDSWLSADKNELIIGGSHGTEKLYKVPINIERNKDYLISFEIKQNKKVENYIHFDFYGDNYGNGSQEFYLAPDSIKEEYIRVERIINSENVPSNSDIYFRIFTESIGEFSIKNLEIHKVVRYYDYEIVYNDGTAMILENKNFIPRFYFVSEVRNVTSLEEAKNILWEEDIFWEYDKFDIKTAALVEDIDFGRIKFNTKDASVDIVRYENNKITLETASEDDSFLIFSDTYYPGWRAYIDNTETKIYRTNGIVKGIYIPEGEHTILFEYTPNHFWMVAIVSLSSFILIITGVIVLQLKRKRRLN